MLRDLRKGKGVPMWSVAAAAGMDSTLLSKIELGRRLPTGEQAAALARYFGVPAEEIQGALMAERFFKEAEKNPEAAARALARIEEGAGEYRVSKEPTAGDKPGAAVNKAKKRD